MTLYTTKVKTANGKVYDLGKFEHPPGYCSAHSDAFTCPNCLVVNAWTEVTDDDSTGT